MSSQKIIWPVVAFIVLLSIGGGIWYSNRSTKSNAQTSTGIPQKYTHIDIKLQGGKLVGPLSTYLVNPGTGLEFSVTSDQLGKIGAPVSPPKTITFTQSPVVFHFITTSSGTFPMTFQANGSQAVVEIGIVTVRATK